MSKYQVVAAVLTELSKCDGSPQNVLNAPALAARVRLAANKALSALAHVEPNTGAIDVDALSNWIREVNGNNNLGAGALAEKIANWQNRQLAQRAYDQSSTGFQECAATGTSCSHGPHGRKGEIQCQYCGAAPAEQQSQSGWKGSRLLPSEPTAEMVTAMKAAWWKGTSAHTMKTTDAYRIYFAMLAAAPLSETASAAAHDVLAERQRQISGEDWTFEHDDAHPCGEIAAFAAVYAMPPEARDWPAAETGYGDTFGVALCPVDWEPKFGGRRRELVKAGALVLAEIERLDRASDKTVK